MSADILFDVDAEGIAWLTLNRPQVYNAISFAMWEELHVLLTRIEYDDFVSKSKTASVWSWSPEIWNDPLSASPAGAPDSFGFFRPPDYTRLFPWAKWQFP